MARIFTKLPKTFLDETWQNLSKDAQAVFIGICRYIKRDGKCFPGEAELGKACGLSVSSVVKAMNELSEKGIVSRCYVQFIGIDKPGFHLNVDPQKNKTVFMHTDLVASGCWADLLPVSRALYVSMRRFSTMTLDDIDSLGLESDEEIEFGDDSVVQAIYRKLEYMICDEPQSILCRHAGIHRSKYHKAFEDLLAHGLVGHLEEDAPDMACYKVYFSPQGWKATTRQERKDFLAREKAAGATPGQLVKACRKARRKARPVPAHVPDTPPVCPQHVPAGDVGNGRKPSVGAP